MSQTQTSQTKVLGLFDITLMTIVANFGLRWLAVAAGIGPSSIFFWFLGALLFFLPLSIISALLARVHPDEGGMYAWTRKSLGEQPGFMVAWLYWVNNIFYYPAVLIFFVTNFAYFLGQPALANNHWYVTLSVLIAFWLIVLISLFGIRASKYMMSFGGIVGALIPTVLLIAFAAAALITFKHSATEFSYHALLPDHHIKDNLSTLTIIMFAMAGVEIIPTFANSVKNPKRDLFWGVLLGALVIFVLYTLGTVAMNILAKPNQIQQAAGLMQVFSIVDQKFGISWFTKVVAGLLTFSELAAVSVWLVAPIVMFFKCTPRGILPDWFHQTNRYDAPLNGILFMGVLVSIIMIVTNLLPSVNNMYQVLVLMSTIVYFIPYLYLGFVFIKSRQDLNLPNYLVVLLGLLVFISTCLGIGFSFPPPASIHKASDIILYEAELILGPLIVLGLGYLLYRTKKPISHQPL